MFSSRRPGKRSIVGSRVCAPYNNGFYWPGVISAIESAGPWVKAGDERFAVEFQDGSKRTFDRTEIIGAGFQPLTKDRLKCGQTVFITHNGREVKGVVTDTGGVGDEVDVAVGEGGTAIRMKADDLRLIESRRSARLSECQQDLASDSSGIYVVETSCSGKRRTHEADFPSRRKAHCHNGHMMVDDCGSPSATREPFAEETMDEHMAALVLTSLSCSPSSPVLLPAFDYQGMCATEYGSSSTSSGVWTMTSSANSSPSPPKSLLSQSAPASSFAFSQHFGNSTSDDADDDIDDDVDEDVDDDDDMSTECGNSSVVECNKGTVYQCTWPGCRKQFTLCPAVEDHIRSQHLRDMDQTRGGESSHEEEFYYTEVDWPSSLLLSTTTQQQQHQQELVTLTAMDHDYLRKEYRTKPLNIPRTGGFHGNSSSLPLTMPFTMQGNGPSASQTAVQSSRSTNESSTGTRSDAVVPHHIAHHLPGSNKLAAAICRKSRGGSDVRKCRKVYGIENRSLWCTQCKWKKACTRFYDMN